MADGSFTLLDLYNILGDNYLLEVERRIYDERRQGKEIPSLAFTVTHKTKKLCVKRIFSSVELEYKLIGILVVVVSDMIAELKHIMAMENSENTTYRP